MKNTMKKLLSLVLVAMLLVCAVPFQAAATEADTSKQITFKVIVDGQDGDPEVIVREPQNGKATIGAMLANWYKLGYKEIKSAYITDANGNGQTAGEPIADAVVKAGESVTVRIVPKDEEPTPSEKPTEAPVENNLIRFQIRFDDSDKTTYTKIATPENGESAVIANLLTYWYGADWNKSYKFERAYSENRKETYTDVNTTVYVDDTVSVRLTTIKKDDDTTGTIRVTFYDTDNKAVSTYKVNSGDTIDSKKVSDAQSKADNKTGYTFKGWKINNKGDLYTSAQVAGIAIKSDVEFYAQLEKDSSGNVNKAPWLVKLYIYKDTKLGSADKVIDITDGIAADGVVDMNDVANVVKKYYTAKTSDGIQYDGLYLAKGNFASDWANDKKYGDTISGIKEMRKEEPVNIIVMISNANAKSSEKADTTNPKTGDMILIPVIFMLVSGAAIAGVYFYNKKRSAR